MNKVNNDDEIWVRMFLYALIGVCVYLILVCAGVL
jgi:hypothetical protein